MTFFGTATKLKMSEMDVLFVNLSKKTTMAKIVEYAENCLHFCCLCLWNCLHIMHGSCDIDKACNYIVYSFKARFDICVAFVGIFNACFSLLIWIIGLLYQVINSFLSITAL